MTTGRINQVTILNAQAADRDTRRCAQKDHRDQLPPKREQNLVDTRKGCDVHEGRQHPTLG